MSKNVSPVNGAASYTFGVSSGEWVILMNDTEGHVSVVQKCRGYASATIAADKWQKKENAAVSKANKSAECAR